MIDSLSLRLFWTTTANVSNVGLKTLYFLATELYAVTLALQDLRQVSGVAHMSVTKA